PSLPPKVTISSSPDGNSNVSAIGSNPAKDEGLLSLTPPPEVLSYLERISQIPNVRQARIAQIQQAIDSQTYAIAAEKLADSLIQELHPHPQETRPATKS
ncbi:MAG TPA: flagellar biosynthesis anti-sigma factor FlgM, partial [Nitrospirales bacterium]|nr:flagellar biosynthesis anti-sigma factor FlgM [Nitrospirales bacterium]